MSKIVIDDLKTFVDEAKPTKHNIQPDSLMIDVRVTHITSIDGRQSDDLIGKFDQLRRGLGMCSLASEYESWLLKRVGSLHGPKGRRKKQEVRIQPETYVKENEHCFGRHHTSTLTYAINIGRVLLDLERRLEGSGYLAVLIFQPSACRTLPIGDRGQLVQALKGKKEVSEFAKQSQGWVDRWRNGYDGE